jgi:putative copper export protein
MSIWYYISIFLHTVLAAFWIGGMLFLPLVLLPAIKNHPDRIALLYKTGISFRYFGWVALTGLFCTGWLNMYFRGIPFSWAFFSESSYGHLVVYKLLIFTVILSISAAHDFAFGKKALDDMVNSDNSRLRNLARWSGRLNVLLALAMALLGLMLARGG